MLSCSNVTSYDVQKDSVGSDHSHTDYCISLLSHIAWGRRRDYQERATPEGVWSGLVRWRLSAQTAGRRPEAEPRSNPRGLGQSGRGGLL